MESPINIVFDLAISEPRVCYKLVSHRGIITTYMYKSPICLQLSAAMPQRRSPMPHRL